MSSSRQSVIWAITGTAFVAATTLASAAAQAGPVLYVDDDAPPGGDGTSWTAAYRDLQVALTFAADPTNGITEIRVAQGTYYPSEETEPGNPRTPTFQL